MNHPTDEFESYALGMLEPDRRSAIDAHVARCATCAAALGSAEATVAAIVESEFAHEPRDAFDHDAGAMRLTAAVAAYPVTMHSPWRAVTVASGLAAAFALATGGLGIVDLRQAAALYDDGAIVHRMVASHFVHAQFLSLAGTPLDAKVVYERRGHWYTVFANGIDRSYRVAVVRRSGDLADERPERFVRRGDAYALALPALGPIEGMDLRDGAGRTVGRVRTPSFGGH